jgi:hypothetical protein
MLASILTLATTVPAVAADQGPARDRAGLQIVTGCLELSPAGQFVLRSLPEPIALQKAGGMEKHVGRTVKVTGEWQNGADGRRLRVAKIEYLAEGCAG